MKKKQEPTFRLDSSRNRYFSESLRRKIVEQIVQKKLRIREASELYEVSRTSIYKWIYRYSELEKGTNTVIQMESESSKTAYFKRQVAELERLYGQKQIEVDYLNKLIELASEDLGYDLKKKHSSQPLSGSALMPDNTHTE